MPRFTFVCLLHTQEEDITLTVESPSRPTGDVLCPSCNKPMQRVLTNTNTVFKGSKESNGYYVPGSNADLGLPSELELEKQAVQKAEDFLSTEDKEMKKDYDQTKKMIKDKLDERVRKIEQKYPGWSEQYRKILKKKMGEKKVKGTR